MQKQSELPPPDIEEQFPRSNLNTIVNSIANGDSKTIYERIEKYDLLDSSERASIVRSLPALLEQLGNQALVLLKPLLHKITKDKVEIAQQLLEQISEIARQLQRFPNFQNSIKTLLIPTVNHFLKLSQLNIKERAGQELGELARKLADNDRGNYVLKQVIEMAHDDESEDNRIVAVQLFSNMSNCLGQGLCEQFVGLEILSLGEDVSFKVRKEAIKQLPKIANLVNSQFFARLLGFYLGKAKDPSNWAIRKTCVDVALQMCRLCNPSQKQAISSSYLALVRDTNKWVRVSAYKSLGPFLHELKGLKVSIDLLKQFCKMVDTEVLSLGKEGEILFSCAFNFPAVLDLFGKEKWQSDLCRVFQKLVQSEDRRIKQTLSESLHQVARIIGQQFTEKYLFKVIDNFFRDRGQEVQLGVVRHMADIMRVLSQEKRDSLAGVFQELQKDQKRWRIRECISQQLAFLLEIYRPQIVFEYIVPILLKFCSDLVSSVREQAAKTVANFVEKLKDSEFLLAGLIESIKAFGTSPKYTQRQTFILMCQRLMDNLQFQVHFLPIFIKLSSDEVVNVKLVLAETILDYGKTKGKLMQNSEFMQLWNRLSNSSDEEVRQVFEDN